MSKKKRIAALEAKVAALEKRLASVEAPLQWTWTNPVPSVLSPFYVGDPPPAVTPHTTWGTSTGGSQ